MKCPPGGDRDEFSGLDRYLAGPEGPGCCQRTGSPTAVTNLGYQHTFSQLLTQASQSLSIQECSPLSLLPPNLRALPQRGLSSLEHTGFTHFVLLAGNCSTSRALCLTLVPQHRLLGGGVNLGPIHLVLRAAAFEWGTAGRSEPLLAHSGFFTLAYTSGFISKTTPHVYTSVFAQTLGSALLTLLFKCQ